VPSSGWLVIFTIINVTCTYLKWPIILIKAIWREYLERPLKWKSTRGSHESVSHTWFEHIMYMYISFPPFKPPIATMADRQRATCAGLDNNARQYKLKTTSENSVYCPLLSICLLG
jgi:hypothetical protein